MRPHNFFIDADPPTEGERAEALLRHRNLVVERIVRSSALTPREYLQPQDKWVLLVTGEAVLHVAGESITLKSADHLLLPDGVSHSVERTSHGTLWLAAHLYPAQALASDMTLHPDAPGAQGCR